MKKLLLGATAALGLLASAGSANAASVTIVFQNPGADLPTAGNFTTGGKCNGVRISSIDLCTIDENLGFDYSKGFAQLNVTAFNSNGITDLMQDLAPKNSGLAILSPGESSSDDQVQLSTGESLLFDFGSAVRLDEIDFNAGSDRNCATPGREGPCGDFRFIVDGNDLGIMTAVDNMPFLSLVGTTFELIAAGPVDGGFAVGSITVSQFDDISQVPVPAAGFFLLSGLAGFAANRRRKSA